MDDLHDGLSGGGEKDSAKKARDTEKKLQEADLKKLQEARRKLQEADLCLNVSSFQDVHEIDPQEDSSLLTQADRNLRATQCWAEARLQVYEKIRPELTQVTEKEASESIQKTIHVWRNLRVHEKHLNELRARAKDLPTFTGPTSTLQVKTIPKLLQQKNLVQKQLSQLITERACVRVRTACDLLKHGDGAFGLERLPVNLSAEPFLRNTILSAANRSSKHLFPEPKVTDKDSPCIVNVEKRQKQSGLSIKNVVGSVMMRKLRQKLDEEDEIEIDEADENNGFSILLKIATKKFQMSMRDVTLCDWQNPALEKAENLDGLPRFNHELLPLLCYNPLGNSFEPRLLVNVPTTIIIRGSICTNFIELNDLDHIVSHASMQGTAVEGLEWELKRIAPARQWPVSHGSIICKRPYINAAGEPLQYATPVYSRTKTCKPCLQNCVPARARHACKHLGHSFSTVALPPTREDLRELLEALRFVAPDTVTVLQKFVPPQGNRAQILRVLRVEGSAVRRFLISNLKRCSDCANSGIEAESAEWRMCVALEHAESGRRVEIHELEYCAAGTKVRDDDEAAVKGPQDPWAKASVLAENIYHMLCLRGKGGADALRAMLIKSEMHAGLVRSETGGVSTTSSSHTSASASSAVLSSASSASKKAAAHASSGGGAPRAAGPVALVPRRMAVDFIKDEDGKLWLLQVLSLLALLVQRYLSLLALLVQKYKYRHCRRFHQRARRHTVAAPGAQFACFTSRFTSTQVRILTAEELLLQVKQVVWGPVNKGT